MKKTRHKKRVVLIAMLFSLVILGGCGSSTTGDEPAQTIDPPQTPSSQEKEPEASQAPKEEADALSSERIAFITQEYKGDNVVEIPYIEYEGETNPEIESINRMLNQGLQFSYEDFLSGKSKKEWIEIKSYPFTTDNYLQVVITKGIYPSYGTDGDVESVNYDRKSKKWLSIEDALNRMGLSEEDVKAGVGESFDSEDMGGLIDSLQIAGFLIRETQEGERIELLLNVTVHNEEGDDWQGFFSYYPDRNDNESVLTRLDANCLFDPNGMDQMEPPLWYQKNAE